MMDFMHEIDDSLPTYIHGSRICTTRACLTSTEPAPSRFFLNGRRNREEGVDQTSFERPMPIPTPVNGLLAASYATMALALV